MYSRFSCCVIFFKLFASSYLLHCEVSCSFGIRTEEKEPLKHFQVPKAFVVAAEKISLNVHGFET